MGEQHPEDRASHHKHTLEFASRTHHPRRQCRRRQRIAAPQTTQHTKPLSAPLALPLRPDQPTIPDHTPHVAR